MIAIEKLARPTSEDLAQLLAVWESSVRATHDFLRESDISGLRPEVAQGLQAVSLWAARESDGRIAGFAGVCGDMLEMLFVRAGARGRGIGRALMAHVLARGVARVDVNERNRAARGFYERMGFAVVGRSPRDSQGRPFPLLHMALGKR